MHSLDESYFLLCTEMKDGLLWPTIEIVSLAVHAYENGVRGEGGKTNLTCEIMLGDLRSQGGLCVP